MKIRVILLILTIAISFNSIGQTLDYENRVGIVLDDGTQVVLFGRAQNLRNDFTSDYYYLPVGLTLSTKEDNKTPEFLFIKYTTEEKADAGGVQGALLHFLMKWGLTNEQEEEAQQKLEAKIEDLKTGNPRFREVLKPRILGPVDVKPDGDESFRIISGTLNNNPNLVTSGQAPVLPGTKAAVAAKMDKHDAQLLAATFEKTSSITDVDVQLFFTYDVLFPAVNGEIILNTSKIHTTVETFFAERNMVIDDSKDHENKDDSRDEYIEDSVAHHLYETLISNKSIEINLDDKIGNELSAKVTEMFFNVFMSSIAELNHANDAPPSSENSLNTDTMLDDYGNAESWKVNINKVRSYVSRETIRINLNYRLNVPRRMYLLGNLAGWYDNVRDNPKCVAEVNLNDKFFQHRDINFILDLEAKEIFDQEVNYVTVNVRKRRSSGNDFEDAFTIGADYIENNGSLASISYAKGQDEKPDLYEYKAQWNLKGGHVFPENPNWIRGDWQGVGLAPPVKPRTIEFEGDLAELKELGVTRATLQLRYQKFDEEIETNIPLTISKGQPLVEKMIFTDRDQQGYAYRLVLNHKEKGKMALDWDAKVNDDYVYATIPKKLQDGDKEFIDKLIKAGKEILRPANKDVAVSKTDRILDKFSRVLDVLDGTSN